MNELSRHSKFEEFSEGIKNLSEISRETLLVEKFKLGQEGNLSSYYAPFDYSNPMAKITIIGITPGLTQMEIAFRTAREGLHQNAPTNEILRSVKRAASFAGSMRINLCLMLDRLSIPEKLEIDAAVDLFGHRFDFLNTMSVVRYPIFKSGRNYTGSNPTIPKSKFLSDQAMASFDADSRPPKSSLIIPLGKCVEESLRLVMGQSDVEYPFVAWGFPHPSGANGHRKGQFEANFESLSETVSLWSQSLAGEN